VNAGDKEPNGLESDDAGTPAPSTRGARVRHRAHRFKLYSWTTFLVVAIVVIVALVVDNTRKVEIGWVFGTGHASLVWVILIAALVGWLAGLGTSFVVRRRIGRARRP
jgi:uncharacterized integral membrane protein